MLTKVNGLFLLGPLLAWGLARKTLTWKQAPCLIVIGVLVFWLEWPWLWRDPLAKLHGFFLKQTDRWVVPTYYLGRVFDKGYPPWHYPLVMAAATLPPALLVAGLWGVWKGCSRLHAYTSRLSSHTSRGSPK